MRLFLFAVLLFFAAATTHAQKYLFYLHGKIIEDQGADAVETAQGFGAYEYRNILAAFRKESFTVLSEVRPRNTDPVAYAGKVVKQIDSLLRAGVQPGKITVIGASKGSVIAMHVSSLLKNKDVNFVFMAGCFSDDDAVNFCGNILSIYEKSDGVGSCTAIKKRSANPVPHYKEIELNTGLRHGFLYKPLAEWVKPAVKCSNNNFE